MIDPFTFDPCPARGRLDKVLAKGECIFQAKLDGTRALLSHTAAGITLTGRRTSVVTGQKLNKVSHVSWMGNEWIKRRLPLGTVIDGELTHPKGFSVGSGIMNSHPEKALLLQEEHGVLEYNMFDLLFLEGHDVRQRPYSERLGNLQHLFAKFIGSLDVAADIVEDFEGPVDRALQSSYDAGYEGLVVKTLSGPYHHLEWAKIKKEQTYDYIIVDYDDSTSKTYAGRGIGALVLGLYVDGIVKPLTRCSGMTEEWRERFYNNKDEFLGRVVEVSAQEMLPTGALRHPRFERIRDDVDAEIQTLEKYGIRN